MDSSFIYTVFVYERSGFIKSSMLTSVVILTLGDKVQRKRVGREGGSSM